jgi:transposase
VDSASIAAKHGGDLTGPSSTDRGKFGTKRHLVVDRSGIPLAVLLSAANLHDSRAFEPFLDSIPPLRRRRPPPNRPEKIHAEKAYDIPRCRGYLRRRRIGCRIARKGVESSAGLGRHRGVVERTLAWIGQFSRLLVRHERRSETHLAFTLAACALICLRFALR